MNNNYFHKSCNKTVRKFYEDFDLLPKEIKEMLWYGNYSPDFDDLRAAWDLAQETGSFESLFKTLNVYEEDRKRNKLEAARLAKLERDKKRRERWQRKWNDYAKHVDVYRVVKVNERVDKHARLAHLLTDEEATKALCARNENKDVVSAARYVYQFVGTKKVEDVKPEEYHKELPPQALPKMLHNAGGKK